MLKIIEALPVSYQVLIFNGALIALLIFVYVAAKYGMRITGSKSGFSLSFGQKKKDAKKSPHGCCDNRYDALESMKSIRKIEREIIELKYLETIKQQMDIAEGLIKSAMTKFLKIYTGLLKKKGNLDPIKTNSCQSYILLLKIIENRLTDKVRFLIRENHFAEKTEQEFDAYIDSKTAELISLVSETLNDLYFYDEDITRAELYDANEDRTLEFEHISRDFFQGCRRIAITMSEKIDLLESQSSEIFSRFVCNN